MLKLHHPDSTTMSGWFPNTAGTQTLKLKHTLQSFHSCWRHTSFERRTSKQIRIDINSLVLFLDTRTLQYFGRYRITF